MEYLVAAVFQSQGYFVRRAVPFRARASGIDITDIDLIAVRFELPFGVRMLICDCKDRQRSKPFERVLWARGLAGFVQSSEVYVALPRATMDLVEFAREGDVQILTLNFLEASYESAYKDDKRPYGSAHYQGYEALVQSAKVALQKDRIATGLWGQARSLYLVRDAYVAINIAIQSLQACSEMLRVQASTTVLREMWRLIIAEFIGGTATSLLRVAIESSTLTGEARKRHIIERITYGDMSPRKAQELWSIAREMAFEASRQANPGSLPFSQIASDIGGIEPPKFAFDVAGLVDRILAAPRVYSEVPQVLDYLLFEQALQNLSFTDEDFRQRFQNAPNDDLLKAARNILVFLRDAAGLDLRSFWPRERSNLPRAVESAEVETRKASSTDDGDVDPSSAKSFPF